MEKNRYTREREVCFGERIRVEDYLGLITFGLFIIIVGIVFIAIPNLVSDFSSWVTQMANQKQFVRPPDGPITGAIIFFGLIGLSNFFEAGIRFLIGRSKRRVLANILSGIALFLLAYLISLYSEHLLRGYIVLAIEVVAVGFLVILYSIVRIFLK